MPRGKRLNLNKVELLRMREECGYNNYDIADALDISYTSVTRMIGSCPREIRGIMSCDEYLKKNGIGKYSSKNDSSLRIKKAVPKLPTYKPTIESETYIINMNDCSPITITSYPESHLLLIKQGDSDMTVPYENILDILEFISWFTREKLSNK